MENNSPLTRIAQSFVEEKCYTVVQTNLGGIIMNYIKDLYYGHIKYTENGGSRYRNVRTAGKR